METKLVNRLGKPYEPGPTQKKFHEDPHQFILLMGGMGSGKSLSGATTGITLSIMFPYNFGVVVRETLKSLKETTLKTFDDWMPPGVVDNFNKSECKYYFKNGSQILFIGAENPEDVRSMELGWYMLDEVNKIPKKLHDEIKLRLRNQFVPSEYYRGMYITNPTSKKHWVWKTFEEGNPNLYSKYLISTMENKKHLPAGYIEAMSEDMSEDEKRRFIDGIPTFDKLGEPVYSDFSYSLHVKKLTYNPYLPILRGWDFGFRSPACVFVQIDEDGRIFILAEVLGDRIKLEDFSQKVFSRCDELFPFAKNFIDYCDPAGSQRTDKDKTSVEILEGALSRRYGGIRKVFYEYQNRSIKKGVKIITQLMREFIGGKMMFQIDESCENMIEGFMGGYHMSEKEDDMIEKDGVYDHLQDAFRYIIMNRSYELEENQVSEYRKIITLNQRPIRNRITGY